jgi:homoserine kinase
MSTKRSASDHATIFSVRVPASTSNLGAGFDCLGLALDLWLEANIKSGSGAPVYTGTLEHLSSEEDFLFRTVAGLQPSGTHLEVDSAIPVSRGLGSSAAARVAGQVLKRLITKAPLDRNEVYNGARVLEGHPDNAGPAVYGGLVLDAARPTLLQLHETLGVAVAIPSQQISTEQARSILPAQLLREEAIEHASRAAALLLGLTRGDPELIRHGMCDVIATPRRARLIVGYADAVDAGEKAGAYGVTISGAGSGIVAITEKRLSSRVADAMASALTRSGNTAEGAAPEVVEGGFQVAERSSGR